MHPDEATEPIVDGAIRHGKPFAVLPCCVFPTAFPSRRLSSGESVKTYADFVSYLQEKDPATIELARLPFEGRNRVVFRRASRGGGAADDDMPTPTGYPLNTAADTAHSAHSAQPALRPHRATPRVEDKPPQTRRPADMLTTGRLPLPVTADATLGGPTTSTECTTTSLPVTADTTLGGPTTSTECTATRELKAGVTARAFAPRPDWPISQGLFYGGGRRGAGWAEQAQGG